MRGAKGDRYYGRVARNYQGRRVKQPWWQVEQREMKALLDLLPDGLSVVDVPFGTGRFVPFYHQKGFSISGLDASLDMLAAAKAELGDAFQGCNVATGTSTDLPYKEAAFDLLVSTRFLRDIISSADAQASLAEFSRVIKSHAIVQLGQSTGEGEALADIAPDEPMRSRLSPEENTRLLKANGLEPVEMRLVKSDPKEASEIFHILCRKV